MRAALAAVILALAGCAGVPTAPLGDARSSASFAERRALLEQVREWLARGRLAVRTAERGDTVSFVWRRDHDHHEVEMFGPLGGGRVRVTQDPGRAELVDRKGNTLRENPPRSFSTSRPAGASPSMPSPGGCWACRLRTRSTPAGWTTSGA